ncbi:helix-turn-helix domain-containing protein [Anaerocolumna sedimenticola]|uniref:Helix-turn-helix domain-containing protein n=1 Tax=Anaerocolumna sedimenticola TaxID=2696063 RepID=A0A6P1TIL0_9FIRM|nr:helix-turn-helix domain-containing protein [Anaerocolumna sedimenticola]QHQ59949.1 helix-turn-helix domain-containing protein [Anaerocolumna sedimenticola]
MDDQKQIIARRIKELRLDKRLTQKELAKQTGLSVSSIIGYENGLREPNSKAMAALERFFRVSGDYLRGEIDRVTFHKNSDVIDNVLKESLDFVSKKIINTESDHTSSLEGVRLLINYYLSLNDTGRTELLKRASELTQISSYTDMF